MSARPRPGQFDYINQYYGLSLKRHSAVTKKDGKRGQVVSADGAHIYIQWDGEERRQGPYHPTSELSYPEEKS